MGAKILTKLTPETSLEGFVVKEMWVAQFYSWQMNKLGVEGPFDSEEETLAYLKTPRGHAQPKLVTVITNGNETYIIDDPDPLTKKS